MTTDLPKPFFLSSMCLIGVNLFLMGAFDAIANEQKWIKMDKKYPLYNKKSSCFGGMKHLFVSGLINSD